MLYSDQEREYIIKRLKEEAAACMGQFGIRRTTVDELVKRVNIPKGTFYLFYKSKELLLFDVIQEQHELVNQKLYQTISLYLMRNLIRERDAEVETEINRLAREGWRVIAVSPNVAVGHGIVVTFEHGLEK